MGRAIADVCQAPRSGSRAYKPVSICTDSRVSSSWPVGSIRASVAVIIIILDPCPLGLP